MKRSGMDWAPELVEAYARAGRLREARRLLAQFEADAASRQAWAREAADRCRRVLAAASRSEQS